MTRTLLSACCVLWLLPALLCGDDWPQWRGPRRDGVWRESGIVKALPSKLEVLWRTEIGGGYAGPAVAGKRVFVTDRLLEKGATNPDDPFSREEVRGFERVHAIHFETGEVLWTHRYPCRYRISYPAGPRATPTVHEGLVYTVGAMGDLFCLEAETGRVRWHQDYLEDFDGRINTWGIASAPLIDGDRLIVLAGGEQDACLALDRRSGEVIWKALSSKDPGYSPPMIFRAGGCRQLIVWTPYHLNSLDPQTGRVYWSQPFSIEHGMSVATPIFEPEEHLLFVSAFYDGPLMMQLDREQPKAEILWQGKSESERRTDKLHSLMCTAVIDGDHIYGVGSYGQLRCLELKTGRRVWETFEATGEGRWWNAFLIRHEDRYWIPNEQGDLIVAKLSPEGYEEIDRAFLIAPTNRALRRDVVWSHPAFAHRSVIARNDREIIRVDLSEED